MYLSHIQRQAVVELFHSSDEGMRHVHFFASIPEELIPYLPGFWWDETQLFNAEIEIAQVNVTELTHLLRIPIWRATGQSELFTTTGEQILQSPERYQDHWKRVHAADLSFPIVLYRKGERIILLDGYHRLVKAVHMSLPRIGAGFLEAHQQPLVLQKVGFLGELNKLSQQDPDFIAHARLVALELLETGDSTIYPVWQ